MNEPHKKLYDADMNGAHYKSKSGLESIDVIEAFELGFNLGNVIKYILRRGIKGDPISDLKKARWYLDREIKNQEGRTK